MAATPKIVVRSQYPYRGGTATVTNVYHFDGGNIGSSGAFTTFSDNVVTAFKATIGGDQTIIGTDYYDAGTTVAKYTKTYSTVGTLTASGLKGLPGECAALLRFSTTQRTSKNHPIYLFNYIREAYIDNASTTDDDLSHAQRSALQTYGTAWITGFSDGTVTHVRAGPNGAVAQTRDTSTFVHHRDFPR